MNSLLVRAADPEPCVFVLACKRGSNRNASIFANQEKPMSAQQLFAYLTGLSGLGAFWIILLIATKKHPWALVIGEDGRPSTSKFQMLAWTASVVFAFLAIYQIRFSSGYRQELPGLPSNLLIAMGISVVTAVSAKSIAVSSEAKSKATVAAAVAAGLPRAATLPPSQSGIFADDAGTPDLGKVQVVLWTVIAVGVFLSKVFAVIHCPDTPPGSLAQQGLPDIGPTLMILMGLGHGAYIGKKISES
jgi:hypothetical protein